MFRQVVVTIALTLLCLNKNLGYLAKFMAGE